MGEVSDDQGQPRYGMSVIGAEPVMFNDLISQKCNSLNEVAKTYVWELGSMGHMVWLLLLVALKAVVLMTNWWL